MNSIKVLKILLQFISSIAVINGNLITLDGECPFADLKPTPIAVVPVLKGKFNAIAETAQGGINRTDIAVTLKQVESDTVKITDRFLSTETDECMEFLIYITATDQLGVYKAQYQVAPDTNFVEYTAYFLALDILTLRALAIICHNLPDSKYQVEIAVLSALTSKYDEITQKQVKKVLEDNNIGYLNEYLVEIERNDKCGFSPSEIIDSLLPSKDALLPGKS
ncbi:uncharacterized protein LOC123298830 [Chrysoperla carnea]|uniref:uncharacterized protein LOC123298830 n=1 Tax=Chrysoperla carnea TaxID=189513 RepID=UPI001D063F1C|nr:uncharacterized protein LOC123298830 [Chrysoperla carnea]